MDSVKRNSEIVRATGDSQASEPVWKCPSCETEFTGDKYNNERRSGTPCPICRHKGDFEKVAARISDTLGISEEEWGKMTRREQLNAILKHEQETDGPNTLELIKPPTASINKKAGSGWIIEDGEEWASNSKCPECQSKDVRIESCDTDEAECFDCGHRGRTREFSEFLTREYEKAHRASINKRSSKMDTAIINKKAYGEQPGKFEGEPEYIEYFWDLTMDSGQDETISWGEPPSDGEAYDFFIITEEDRQKFSELKDIYGIAIWTTENGFVEHELLNTEQDYTNAKKDLYDQVENLPQGDEAVESSRKINKKAWVSPNQGKWQLKDLNIGDGIKFFTSPALKEETVIVTKKMHSEKSGVDGDGNDVFQTIVDTEDENGDEGYVTQQALDNTVEDVISDNNINTAEINKKAWDSTVHLTEEQQAEEAECKECGVKIPRGQLSGVDKCPKCTRKWLDEYKSYGKHKSKPYASLNKKATSTAVWEESEDVLENVFGGDAQEMLDAIIQAMSDDELRDHLNYIKRMYDYNPGTEQEANRKIKANLNPEDIDGAKYIKHDPETGLVFIWHGGHTVNIYDGESGEEVDVFTMGGGSDDSLDQAQVEQSIEEHIKDVHNEMQEGE